MSDPYYYVIDRNWKIKKSSYKIFSGIIFIFIAMSLATWAIIPLFEYQFKYARNLENLTMVSPASTGYVLGQQSELLNINQWFTNIPHLDWSNPIGLLGTEYYISIPSLRISEAKVVVGSDDLSTNLIHYNGTALPGEIGTSVIFGHSILPQFYDPKNYKAIFSTLHTLKNGSEIYVKIDNITYKYIVSDQYIVESDDFGVLTQSIDKRGLKLITCTPPGTYLKRLVINSELQKYDY